jgi:hypothetical protein
LLIRSFCLLCVEQKCLMVGEAKATYGTGAFVLFNTGNEVVRSKHGLISTVRSIHFFPLVFHRISTTRADETRLHVRLPSNPDRITKLSTLSRVPSPLLVRLLNGSSPLRLPLPSP